MARGDRRTIAPHGNRNMIPNRRGTVSAMIPPDDLATAAFVLRHLNPAGADQVLQQARSLYRQTSPLRFADVCYEFEKNNGFHRNNDLESAMPVEPNQVILGSLFGEDSDGGLRDQDYYRLDLTAWPVGTPIVLDIDEFTAVINPPEAGILAVGRIVQQAVVHEGQLASRRRLRLTMSCDHRVIDGATGAQFLKTLKAMLENPLALVW